MAEPVAFVAPPELPSTVASAIAAAKGGDALAPVYVLVRSTAAGRSLAHRLARNGGVANVRFLTLSRLAEALLPGDARPRRLTGDLRRELVRIVATEARPPLDSHASPALIQTLVQAFGELRRRTDTEVDALDSQGPLARELVRLYRRFSDLSQPYDDERSLVEAAERALDTTSTPVVAVVHEPLEGHAQLFVDRMRALGRVQIVGVLSGDAQCDVSLASSLGAHSYRPAAALPLVDEIVIAPDAEAEVQLAVSQFLVYAEAGVPFARMALLFPSASPYALIAHEQLRAAGIPWSGSSALSLTHSVAGRFVTGLTAMVADRFSRASVLDWLSSSPLRDPATGRAVPASRWRAVALQARVGVGPHSWSERLSAFATVRLSSDEEDRDAQAAVALSDFVAPLQEWAAEERKTTWSQWCTWLQQGINLYLGSFDERVGWPSAERRAAESVETVIARMGALDELKASVSVDVFAAAVADAVRSGQPGGSDSNGVFVGTFADAAGFDFEVTAGCGMAEGSIPSRAQADGVLAVLQAPGLDRRVDEERRAFLLALASGRRRVLSAPAADQRAQRQSRPSPWLLEQAGMLNGSPVKPDALTAGTDAWPWLRVAPSFTAAVMAAPVSISPQHDAVRALASGAEPSGVAAMAAEVIRSRDGQAATEFDGVVGAHAGLTLGLDRPLGPTRLEDYAVCPFRFFLKVMLKVGEQTEEDDPFGMAVRDRGILVHAALEEFVRDVGSRTSPGQRWSDVERARLAEIAERLHHDVHRSGRSPGGLLREAELLALRDTLMAVLDEDESMRAHLGVVPDAGGVEVPFGVDGVPPVVVERPVGEPVAFRGRIDRLDRAPDGGSAVAFDYKSGKARTEHKAITSGDPVANGRKLQLAVYAMHAESVVGEDASISAKYWFTGQPRKQSAVGFEWNESARERAVSVIDTMAKGIEGGVFPLVPGDVDRDSFKNCMYCPFDDICPSDRGEAWSRKQTDESVGVYHELYGGSQ